MTINGVHTVDPCKTIHYQLLLAAYIHGIRYVLFDFWEELLS